MSGSGEGPSGVILFPSEFTATLTLISVCGPLFCAQGCLCTPVTGLLLPPQP